MFNPECGPGPLWVSPVVTHWVLGHKSRVGTQEGTQPPTKLLWKVPPNPLLSSSCFRWKGWPFSNYSACLAQLYRANLLMVWECRAFAWDTVMAPGYLQGSSAKELGEAVNGPWRPREGGRPLSPCPAGTCLPMTYGFSVHKLSVCVFPSPGGPCPFHSI